MYLVVEAPGLAAFVDAGMPEDGYFGHCKIGISQSPPNRMRKLATGNPHNLRLMCVVPAEDTEAAASMEEALHKRFIEHRTTGEWFCFCREIAWAMFDLRSLWDPEGSHQVMVAKGLLAASYAPPARIVLDGMVSREHFRVALETALLHCGNAPGRGSTSLFDVEVAEDGGATSVRVSSNTDLTAVEPAE